MDNIPRVLPPGLSAKLNPWPVPAPFLEVKKRSGMSWAAMLTTLNCGLGMVWIVEPEKFENLRKVCAFNGHKTFDLGEVEKAAGSEPSWALADPAWEGYDL
jgi:phosphoribosylformylglycinamidine cyclo-ligase